MPGIRQISILIPVYEFDMTQLVPELVSQSIYCEIDYEIICIDDASSEEYRNKNRSLLQLENVSYRELDKNIGRSAIRNLLADQAKYDYLLFIDCDSKVRNSYMLNYMSFTEQFDVLYGGRHEQSTTPEHAKLLRWTYGKKREEKNKTERNQDPYHCFTLNNTVISKKLFQKIKLDESLTQYGHEDTLFGFELKKRNKKVVHIDNYTIHLGLETNEQFLTKTRQGVENLYLLYKKGYFDADNKLLLAFSFLQKTGLTKFVYKILSGMENKIYQKLKSGHVSMFKFDLLKLQYLLKAHYGLLS